MGQSIQDFFDSYLGDWYLPDVKVTDIIEIVVIAFLVYHLMVWIKNTKAWMLLKGIGALAVFILIAAIFRMNTILWLVQNSISVLATAALIVFQPELRRALEKLGQKNLTNPYNSIIINPVFMKGARSMKYYVVICFNMACLAPHSLTR